MGHATINCAGKQLNQLKILNIRLTLVYLIAQTEDAIKIFDVKYPDGVAVFIFDCSSAHEAFASDALLAHKMNRGPGGVVPRMHDTTNPLNGETQTMQWPDDTTALDEKGVPMAGKQKGMEQILLERGLLERLPEKSKIKICTECSTSQKARDKARRAAKAREDEVDGSGLDSLSARSEGDAEEGDLVRSRDCCMTRVLSLQPDFVAEKPLLQLLIEQAGHKCLFLPKFHCELNPIEMVWGQTKRRKSRFYYKLIF